MFACVEVNVSCLISVNKCTLVYSSSMFYPFFYTVISRISAPFSDCSGEPPTIADYVDVWRTFVFLNYVLIVVDFIAMSVM